MYVKSHRCAICRMLVLLAGLFFFCTSVMAAAPRSEPRVLRVAFPISRGISEIDQYGNYKGLFVDYLNEIAKYTDWQYEYIPVSADDLINEFLAGKFDLMGGNFYQPGFEKYFAYPKYSTGNSKATLLCRRSDNSLQSYNLSSLNGKTIGVYEKATEKIRHLNEFLKSNDVNCELKYYPREAMDESGNLYRQLRDGEVDMLLGNELETGGEFRMVASFQAQAYYIVTTVGNNEILDELNTALEHILESNPEFAEEVYDANFPDTKLADIQFNEGERRYIEEKETLSVAVVKSWHPFYCVDASSGHHDGLLPDLLNRISEFSGLKFTYLYADTYEEALQMVRQGKADIMGAYMGADEQAFIEGLALSRSYITLNNIVLKNKSVRYPDSQLACGVLAGRTLPSDLQAAEIRSYDTPHEMVAAVNSGEVGFIYGVSATLEQEMQSRRYLNVVPVTRGNNNTTVAFAMARPIQPELLTILNKSIGNMSTEEKATLLDQNLVSVGYTNLTLQDLIYADPVAFIVVIGLVLILIMLGILIAVRGRMKNSLMKSELEAAQAKSQAKSDFLSRMSHEIRTPMNAIVGLTNLACMEKDVPGEVQKDLEKIRSSSRYLLSLINDILDMSRIENGRMEIEQENFSLGGLLDALQGMMRSQAEQKTVQFDESRQIIHEWIVSDPIRLRQVLTNLLSNAIKFTSEGGAVSLRVEELGSDGQTATYRFSVQDTGIGIPAEAQRRIFASFEQLGTSSARSEGTGLGLPISSSIVRLLGGDLQVRSEPGKGSEFYTILRFPLGTEEETPAVQTQSGQQQSLQGVRVLLAEDNDLNAEIAQQLLEIQGMQVCRAANGQEAVDMFAASQPGEYQIVLMDIRMPVKDGQEATREIRASGRPDADVPIIAMTANSFKEDEEEAREAGMTGFVPKPVEPDYLFSVIRESL